MRSLLSMNKLKFKNTIRRFNSDVNISNPIELETLDVDLFRSTHLWRPSGARAVYGGQVVGQALAASTQCVKDNKLLHSLHSYFIKGGNPDMPIIYRVRRLNTTNNFETHSISGKQNGQTIFSCQASYHRPENSSLFHERCMPATKSPEESMSQEDRLREFLLNPNLPQKTRNDILETLKNPFALEVREVDPIDIFKPEKKQAKKLIWMKTKLSLEHADSNTHRCFAAYASDWGLAGASLLPHGIYFGHPQLKVILFNYYQNY